MKEPLLQVTDLSVELGGAKILRKLTLSVSAGEIIAIVGVSGSGKSTLLHAIAGFISDHSGSVRIGEQEVGTLSGPELCELRRTGFGLMTQDFHLLRKLSARKNVAIPHLMGGVGRADALRQADSILERLGLGDQLETVSDNLSRGQRQRVAFARSVSHRRPLLILDEPTSSLDRDSSKRLLDLIAEFAKSGIGVLLVTHDDTTIGIADHVYTLEAGTLVSQGSDA